MYFDYAKYKLLGRIILVFYINICKLVRKLIHMEVIEITKEMILKIYKPVESSTHKGNQGHALLIGGSYGKVGSMVLSAKACLKSGCGLVTTFVPKCGYEIVQVSFPEAMVLTDKKEKIITEIEFNIVPKAIGIGMGIGQELETQEAFHEFLVYNSKPLLVDADGINILAKNKNWASLLPAKTILTPHFKELERLIGSWNSEAEKLEMAQNYALKNNLIIVVKGSPTLILDGNTCYKNTTGNAALATAGSGDSLSGIITSFLAQGYEPINAALFGVYIHGLTADIALSSTGFESFIASDISNNLGKAFLSLKNS